MERFFSWPHITQYEKGSRAANTHRRPRGRILFVRVCQCCLHESNRESKMSCWVWHYVFASLQVCIFRTLPLSSSFLLILLSLSVSFLLCVCLFLYIFVRSLTNSLPAYLQSTFYIPPYLLTYIYVLSHLPTCLLATCHLPTCLPA